MKVVKTIALVWFVLFMSSAVSNWGGDVTMNPIAVFTGLMVSIAVYACCEIMGD